MIEQEAKKCWCPYAKSRVITMGLEIVEFGKPDVTCVGSACMAWRWVKTDSDYKFGPADDEGKIKVLDSPITKYGYCGLAGKP